MIEVLSISAILAALYFFGVKKFQFNNKSASLAEQYSITTLLYTIVAAVLLSFFLNSLVLSFAATSVLGAFLSVKLIKPSFNSRLHNEKWMKVILISCAGFSIFVTVAIVGSIVFEAVRFFTKIPVSEFLFGLSWSPQMAIRADQVGSSGAFGSVPVFLGTFLITLIAMFIATPLGLFSAIYLSEYASENFRDYAKPALEILAGIPTVVYGYFAAVVFGPFIRDIGENMGLSVAGESAFAAGIIMGVMIIPFVMSLSDDVIRAVPKSLREASLGIGATKSETIKEVIIPAALPGIIGAILLAVSRGIGETMIVVMAAGLAANLTFNPFDSVTTVTAQIVTLLVGDQEFNSPKTLAAFALSLVLFVITLILNLIAMGIVRKFREKYE